MNTTMIPQELTRERLIEMMEACEQSPGQSVLDHGRQVAQTFELLRAHIELGTPVPAWWRLPTWIYTPGLLELLPSPEVLREYQIYHDCGKPLCRIVDETDRAHFPDHARMSELAWLATGGDPAAARLMGLDMLAHTLKPEDAPAFAALPEAGVLLLTALAEIHANAEMFGGQDSDNFKAKAKRLDKRGRQIIPLILNTQPERRIA